MILPKYFKKPNFIKILLTISVLSFFLRLFISLHLTGLTDFILVPPAELDSGVYMKLSNSILSGGYKGVFYFQPFYYAIFLPAIRYFSPNSLWGVIFVQCTLGGASVYLTGLAFSKLFDWKCGLVGALLLMFSSSVIILTPFLLIATLQTFWIILLLYLLILSYEKKMLRYWALTGIVFACSILTRGNIILLLPVFLIVAYISYNRKIKPAFLAIALFCVCAYVPQIPFSIHNYKMTKQWVGPSTARDAVLAFGNTPDSPPGGVVYTECYSFWQKQFSSEDNKITVPENIIKWAKHSPGAYLELKWRTFLLYWTSNLIPNNVKYNNLIQKSSFLSLPIFLSFNILGVLGLWGMCLALRKKYGIMVFISVIFVVIYSVSIIIFYMLERFRVPTYPLLCGFGGFAIISFIGFVKKNNKKDILLGIIFFVCSALFVNAAYPLYQHYIEKYAMLFFRPNGTSFSLENSSVIYDNGPPQFGGWSLQPVDNKILLMKRFILDKTYTGKTKGVYFLEFPIQTNSEVEFDCRAFIFKNEKTAGTMKIKTKKSSSYSVSLPIDFTVEKLGEYIDVYLEIIPVKGHFGLYVDMQRDYGRTKVLINNKIISLPELVCKLIEKQ